MQQAATKAHLCVAQCEVETPEVKTSWVDVRSEVVPGATNLATKRHDGAVRDVVDA